MLITGITAYVVAITTPSGKVEERVFIEKKEAESSAKIARSIYGSENVSIEAGDAFGNRMQVNEF